VVKLSEWRRKLLGPDAPAKSRVHVITEDVLDAEIAQLTAEPPNTRICTTPIDSRLSLAGEQIRRLGHVTDVGI